MEKQSWGADIWEEKIVAQDEVSVILGTGATQADLDRNTTRIVGLMERTFFPRLAPAARVLDVGTGPAGRFAIALAKRGYRVTGLDGSPTTLAKARAFAREAGVSVDFLQADFSDFETPHTYDALICVETFFHLPGHLALDAFRSFHRALAPGGTMLVEFALLNEMSVRFLAWNLFYRCVYVAASPLLRRMGRKSFHVTVTRVTEAEVTDIARRSGFEVVERDGSFYTFKKI